MKRSLLFAATFSVLGPFAAIAQHACTFGQHQFLGETCSALSRISWRSPEKEELELSLLSTKRDRLSCDHLRALRSQANSLLSFIDFSGEGRDLRSTQDYIYEAQFRIAAINRFQSYALNRFFSRSQFLDVSVRYPPDGNSPDDRLVVIFNGTIAEYALDELRETPGADQVKFNILTNSAEMCFRNDMLVVVYQDTFGRQSLFLYRQPIIRLALLVSFEDLERLQEERTLYRNRTTDNNG